MSLRQGQFLSGVVAHNAWGAAKAPRLGAQAEGKPAEFPVAGGYWHAPVSVRAKLENKLGNEAVRPTLRVLDGSGLIVTEMPYNETVEAAKTAFVVWQRGWFQEKAVGEEHFISGLAAFLLEPGWTLQVTTIGGKGKTVFLETAYWHERFEPYGEHDVEDLLDIKQRLARIEEGLGGAQNTIPLS